jgi:hypothetical protein
VLASFISSSNSDSSTLVVLNLGGQATGELNVHLPPPTSKDNQDSKRGLGDQSFYRYTVTMAAPPYNKAGDLPGPISVVSTNGSGLLSDATGLPPRSVTLYTTAPEKNVKGGATERPMSCVQNGQVLHWEPHASASYYRVVKAIAGTNKHTLVWSVVETSFNLKSSSVEGDSDVTNFNEGDSRHAVQLVDRFGVASAVTRCLPASV